LNHISAHKGILNLNRPYSEGVQLHRWPTGILEALEKSWADVANEEAGADTGFRRVWRSLKTFRADYAIWRELSRL